MSQKWFRFLCIGGADGPTTVFFAGKIPDEGKQAEYTSISMEEAKEVFSAFDLALF